MVDLPPLVGSASRIACCVGPTPRPISDGVPHQAHGLNNCHGVRVHLTGPISSFCGTDMPARRYDPPSGHSRPWTWSWQASPERVKGVSDESMLVKADLHRLTEQERQALLRTLGGHRVKLVRQRVQITRQLRRLSSRLDTIRPPAQRHRAVGILASERVSGGDGLPQPQMARHWPQAGNACFPSFGRSSVSGAALRCSLTKSCACAAWQFHHHRATAAPVSHQPPRRR